MTITKFLKLFPIYPQHIPQELDRRRVFTRDGSARSELLGCLPNYRSLHDLVLTKGRFINDQDIKDEAEVCVLATSLARSLFPFGDSLGNPVNIGGNLYVVVGEESLPEQI